MLQTINNYIWYSLIGLLQSTGKHKTVFGSLDLVLGLCQIPLVEQSKEMTEFSALTSMNGSASQWAHAMLCLPYSG